MWKKFFSIAAVSSLIAQQTNTLKLHVHDAKLLQSGDGGRGDEEKLTDDAMKTSNTTDAAQVDAYDPKLLQSGDGGRGDEEKLTDDAMKTSNTTDAAQVDAYDPKLL